MGDIQRADEQAFALAQRNAKALAASALVPKDFQGNVPNVLIAMDMANRLGCSPMMVMQNMHIIHGRPAFSAQFLIATLNAGGEWHPIRYETRGTDPSRKDFAMRAVARHKATCDVFEGPWIDWKMVDGEGWSKKSGSKWLTMPEVMFRYRAAALFVRLYSPQTAMGVYTAEEVQDMRHAERASGGSRAMALLSQPVEDNAIDGEVVEQDDEPAPDYSNATIGELVALVAGKWDEDFDAVLERCLPEIGSKATTLGKLTDAEVENARAWCLAELEVSNG